MQPLLEVVRRLENLVIQHAVLFNERALDEYALYAQHFPVSAFGTGHSILMNAKGVLRSPDANEVVFDGVCSR